MSRLAASHRYCERLARAQAGNFYYGFLILPRPQRLAMCALYAFMRVADDLSDDDSQSVEAREHALTAWRAGLEEALIGRHTHPIHPALQDCVVRYDIPPSYLRTLLDGVSRDLVQHDYRSFSDLKQYCYQVASVVGLACIRIWGCKTREAEPFAVDQGIAMQLTNILRDVAEDARRGRLYIPLEDLEKFGVTRHDFAGAPAHDGYRQLMQYQARRAEEYYRRAEALREFLPPPGRAILQVMTGIYHELLATLVARDFREPTVRVRVPRWRKLALLAAAIPVRFGWTGNGRVTWPPSSVGSHSASVMNRSQSTMGT